MRTTRRRAQPTLSEALRGEALRGEAAGASGGGAAGASGGGVAASGAPSSSSAMEEVEEVIDEVERLRCWYERLLKPSPLPEP